MHPFLHSGSLALLGWCLLNSVWQMAVLWLLYQILTRNNKRFSAGIRHNLVLVFSTLGFGWFLYSLFVSDTESAGLTVLAPLSFVSPDITTVFRNFLSVGTAAYLAILVFRTGRYLRGFYQLQQTIKQAENGFSESLQLFSDRICRVLGIRKPVSIRLVNWTDTAQTAGFLKPLVLLPVALVNRLTMEQAETILLHELMHIRRNDYLINILMGIFRTLFFFNPFARLFFKTISREREQACDDGVLRWNYSAPVYAEALFALEKFRQLPHSFSLAADGKNPQLLMERICRITGQPVRAKNGVSPLLSWGLVTALFLFALNSFVLQPMPAADALPPVHLMVQTSSPVATEEPPGSAMKPRQRIVPRKESVSPAARPATSVAPPIKTAAHAAKHANQGGMNAVLHAETCLFPQESEPMNGLLQFADHAAVRNYSNEKAAEPSAPPPVDLNGAPYVPSASFSYSPVLNDTLLPEDVLLQNKLKALVEIGKIRTIEIQSGLDQIQSSLNREINQKLEMLRQLQAESHLLSLQKTGDPRPALLRIEQEIRRKKQDIERKKAEIDRLMMQLQVAGGQIIVI